MDIDTVGHMLEEKGLSHSEIDEWFEHAGVKGMKWGVRRYARIQKNIDRTARIRDKTASKTDRFVGANSLTFTSKQAGKQLERGAKMQKNIANGKSFVGKMMFKYEKTLMADLNFRQDDD